MAETDYLAPQRMLLLSSLPDNKVLAHHMTLNACAYGLDVRSMVLVRLREDDVAAVGTGEKAS